MRNVKLMTTVVILLIGVLASAQFVSAETMTLNSTDDTWMNGFAAQVNYNYGTDVQIYVYNATTGPFYTSLLSFDLSGTELAGATIDSVMLTLTTIGGATHSKYGSIVVTTGVYELLNDFVEGTKSGATAGTGEPCWNWRKHPGPGDPPDPAGLDWNTDGALGSGTDHGTSLLASFAANQRTVGTNTVCDFISTVAFKTAVQNNIGGEMNLMAQFIDTPQYLQMFYWHSKQSATAAYRPKLTIGYTPIPEPSSIALLACGLVGLLAYAWRKRK